MQSHWIERKGSDTLIVFVLGWACDYRIVEHIKISGADILCLYDYRNLELERVDISGYSRSYLFAWSFGVMVAERLFSNHKFTRTIALNGTPTPIHERFGIDPRRIDITIKGLQTSNTDAFNRLAYAEYYEHFRPLLSPRTLQESIDELISLQAIALQPHTPSITWDRAVVGSKDVIFLPENMVRYWGELAKIVPLPHFVFGDQQIIIGEIEHR